MEGVSISPVVLGVHFPDINNTSMHSAAVTSFCVRALCRFSCNIEDSVIRVPNPVSYEFLYQGLVCIALVSLMRSICLRLVSLVWGPKQHYTNEPLVHSKNSFASLIIVAPSLLPLGALFSEAKAIR